MVLRIGDVALDLAQGRPVQVIDVYEGDAEAWSEEHDYDLTENYGNSRLDAAPADAVYDCVYVGSLLIEPSKSYAFPASRLARVEVDAVSAEARRPADRIEVDALAALFTTANDRQHSESFRQTLGELAQEAGFPRDLVQEALELAQADALAAEPEVSD